MLILVINIQIGTLNLSADLLLEVDMINFINSRIRDFKTLVNPIMGLPTPHQRSVNRVISRLSDLEKSRDYWFGFEPVNCHFCGGSGQVSFDDSCFLCCPSCGGDGIEYQFLNSQQSVTVQSLECQK